MSRTLRLSMRQYAKHRGVSPEAVSKAVREKRISVGPDGKIDPAAADREWDENTVARAGNDPGVLQSGLPGYAASRAAREAYAALIAKQEYEQAAGLLVSREDARRVMGEVVSTARARLLAMAATLAPVVAVETDERRCFRIIDDYIRDVLTELSDSRSTSIGGRTLGSASKADG